MRHGETGQERQPERRGEERDRETERVRETERNRESESQRDRDRDRERETGTERESEKERNGFTGRGERANSYEKLLTVSGASHRIGPTFDSVL